MLGSWIAMAREQGASDLHVEAGLPLALRVGGELRTVGEPVRGADALAAVRDVIGDAGWPEFVARRSFDGSRVLGGVQCRINAMATARGVGLAVRLLAGFQPTLDNLNLHPDLRRLVGHAHGLVVICGPTGSGKTTTLAALLHEINVGRPRHVVTIENPIEYTIRPRRAFVRQREVGRDTPSFEQALLDAMREDPDVLVVGEMRRRETMQLTLDAAETGHLVLATMHSASAAEALQRIVSSFPPETQAGVGAQLADCLVAVLAQRLSYRADAEMRVPECELLVASDAVRHAVREGRWFKLASALEVGAEHGMWTFDRYRRWLDARTGWNRTGLQPDGVDAAGAADAPAVALPSLAAAGASGPPGALDGAELLRRARPEGDGGMRGLATSPGGSTTPPPSDAQIDAAARGAGGGVHVIDEDDVGSIDQLLDELSKR